MADENEKIDAAGAGRRAFVTTSAKVAVTAPAAAMLLSASMKPASAQSANYASSLHILDDFTFGNDVEDIDAHSVGNINPGTGQPQQDDHV
jgi:3-deoxy-D-manno-octulosonic acid (KDO) 8-phosphate synthase